MTVYATRLANGMDTAARMRRSDSLYLFPAGATLARSGLRPDGGGAVTVTDGTMTVTVTPFTAWIDGGASDAQGGYPFVSDASLNLAIDPGHATLARVDTVVAQVRDDVYDGSGFTDARVYVVKGADGGGAPAVPQSAIPLRDINVPAGASAGTGGLTSGNLGADRRQYVTGLGGVLPVASATERDGIATKIEGMAVYRKDTDQLQVWNGAAWDSYLPHTDTGWQTWTTGVPAGWTIKYRDIGRIRYMTGAADAATLSDLQTILATGLPPASSTRDYQSGAFKNMPAVCYVDAFGVLRIVNPTTLGSTGVAGFRIQIDAP